jgi:hypothetical protein
MLSTTFWGCKKEIIESSGNAPIKYQNRYQGEMFSDTRSYENAILAVEYELNMEVADTNMLSGATEYGNVSIDSFIYDSYSFTGNEVTGADQSDIYDDIRGVISDSLNNYYENSAAGNAIIVDLNVDDFNENKIIVKYAHATIMTGCGCSFTTNLPWSDLDINVKNCGYFDDKANNYYASCMEVRSNIGQYYDFKIEQHPNNGLVYFTGGDISSATQTTVYLDSSMTPSEQIVTRNYLYEYWDNYTQNQADGRNELLKMYIGGTVGNQYTLFIHHLVRAKYSVGLPF